MKDLKTIEGINAEVKKIEDSFLLTLRSNLFEICPNAVCKIGHNVIQLGIAESDLSYRARGYKMASYSNIDLFAYDRTTRYPGNKINCGLSEPFDPTIAESYWRIIHAATMLKNWELMCVIVNDHCMMYSDLAKEVNAIRLKEETK